MSGLTEADYELLDVALWGGRIHDDVPTAVEQIAANVLARFKADAAAAIEGRRDEALAVEPVDLIPSSIPAAERAGWLNGLWSAARIVERLPTNVQDAATP